MTHPSRASSRSLRSRLPLAGAALARLSRASDHAHRAVGRGRRHRRDGTHHRHAAREGARPAGQRRQPHRRQRRRRPQRDRAARAPDGYTIGIITVEIGDDALAGAHRAHRRVVHAARARQRRSGRRSGRGGLAVQVGQGSCSTAIKANPGKLKASGTGQGGIWHLALAGHAARREDRSATACRGCRRNGAAPACRTSSPAASRSSRARCPKRAR